MTFYFETLVKGQLETIRDRIWEFVWGQTQTGGQRLIECTEITIVV